MEETFDALLRGLGKKGGRAADKTAAALEECYGQALPQDLQRLANAYDKRRKESPKAWGWAIRIDVPSVDFERWSEAQQGEAENSSIHFVQYFGNLVYIGNATDGDLFHAYVDPEDSASAEVGSYDHEEGAVYPPPEADSIATLSVLSDLGQRVGDAGDSDSETLELNRIIKGLVGKTPMRGHFREVKDFFGRGTDWEGSYRKQTPVGQLLGRAEWLMRLLRDGSYKVASIKKALAENPARALPSAYAIHFAPEALYWLSRSFWLNQDQELKVLVKLAKKSRVPLVRSAAGTYSELQGGRKRLGKLADVHEVRRKLLAELGKLP